jgi:hypothetical protein
MGKDDAELATGYGEEGGRVPLATGGLFRRVVGIFDRNPILPVPILDFVLLRWLNAATIVIDSQLHTPEFHGSTKVDLQPIAGRFRLVTGPTIGRRGREIGDAIDRRSSLRPERFFFATPGSHHSLKEQRVDKVFPGVEFRYRNST